MTYLGRIFPAVAALVFAVATPTPAAAGACKPLHGHFTSVQVPPPACTSPVAFCTAGQLWGGLQGTYAFTMETAIPSPAPTTPGATFYTGTSVVSLDDGGTVIGTDNGVVDLNPFGTHRMVSLITFTSGAGGYEGATGYLQLRGEMDLVAGTVSGEFFGEVCRP